MRKKIILASLSGAVLALAIAAGISGQFIDPHAGSGNVSTAQAAADVLYICQPSGTTVSPQCPIDTSGADENIFAANEDLLPGSVRWQKIRLRNVGTEPWDVLSMQPNWAEISDPSGACNTIPEGVVYSFGVIFSSSTGPGVTILGTVGGGTSDPIDGVGYDVFNDNHSSVASSAQFRVLNQASNQTIHIVPNAYEDVLLGVRLPPGTPDYCLNVVWQLTTTWSVQVHVP